MSNELMRKEVQETIDAGERAFESLKFAREKLNSARNWGIYDILGGGFLGDYMKHSRIRNAAGYMDTAKHDLQIFQRELRDVQVPMNFRVEVGSFLTFADFFLDGIVADCLVQSKISEAREQVEEAMDRVVDLLSELKGMLQ